VKLFFSFSFIILLFAFAACQETPAPAPPVVAPTVAVTTPAPAATVTGEMKATPSGLKYQDLVIGEGKRPLWGQTVNVEYVGKLENGKEFERGKFKFALGDKNTLKGFNIGIGGGDGIDGMKIGGKRIIILPPDLAYGKEGNGKVIPPNATLKFEIELLDVIGAKSF
jgi:FKBP-type peptidyl-prolyl cis-trans isomerase